MPQSSREVTALLVAVGAVRYQLAPGSIGLESVSLFLAMFITPDLLFLATDVYYAVALPRFTLSLSDADDDFAETQCQSLDEFDIWSSESDNGKTMYIRKYFPSRMSSREILQNELCSSMMEA